MCTHLIRLLCFVSRYVVFVAAEFMSIFANVARKGGKGEKGGRRGKGMQGLLRRSSSQIIEKRRKSIKDPKTISNVSQPCC